MENHRSRADDRCLANLGSREYDRANPDKSERVYSHAPTEEHPRRKMDVMANPAIMLDNGCCVYDAVPSDPGTRIDHGSRHDHGALFQPGRWRYHRGRMDQRCGQHAAVESALKACGPHFIPSNGHHKMSANSVKRFKVPAGFEDFGAAKSIVNE